MKKIAIACVLAAVSFPTVSFADTKNFEGFSAAFNLGLLSGGLKVTDTEVTDGLGGKQSFVAGFDLAYGLKTSDTSVITLGVDADLTKPKIFSTTSDGNLTATQKNRFGIFLAPGAVINKDTLVYGKLSYNSMKGELSNNDGSLSETFRGIGYGFGVRTMISPTAFVKVEVNRVSFGAETIGDASIKPSGTTGVLGIGTSF